MKESFCFFLFVVPLILPFSFLFSTGVICDLGDIGSKPAVTFFWLSFQTWQNGMSVELPAVRVSPVW